MGKVRIQSTKGVSGCIKHKVDRAINSITIRVDYRTSPLFWRVPVPIKFVKVSGIGVLDGTVDVFVRGHLIDRRLRSYLGSVETSPGESFTKTFEFSPAIPIKYIDMEFGKMGNGFKLPKICWGR